MFHAKDFHNKLVRLLRDLRTQSGRTYLQGTVMRATQCGRSVLRLALEELPPPRPGFWTGIRGVSPYDVQPVD
jgi:hypothetical protein